MTFSIAFVLIVLVAALFLFVTEWLRVDLVAMMVLLSLTLAGVVTHQQALMGFSNEAVVTICAVFVLSGGLFRSGVANILGRQIMRLAGGGEPRLISALMMTVGLLSGIMNNIGVTALMLPVVLDIARRTEIPPSKLLIPLAYGSLLGGLTTQIGTAPNILISGALADSGFVSFSMFDFTPLGLTALLAGIVYMVTVGRHLLPSIDLGREAGQRGGADLGADYDLDTVLFTLSLPQESPLSGRTLVDCRCGSALGINVLAISRDGQMNLAPQADSVLRGGDSLIVEGRPDQLDNLREWRSLTLEESWISIDNLVSASLQFNELHIGNGSELIGKTIVESSVRWRFSCNVLAIQRDGEVRLTRLRRIPLRAGDRLLVIANVEQAEELSYRKEFESVVPMTADEVEEKYRLHRRLLSVGIPEDSALGGMKIAETRLGEALGLTILGIRRGDTTRLMPTSENRLQAGDSLLIEGREEDISLLGALQELRVEHEATPEIEALQSPQVGMVEVTLDPRSRFAGQTLRDLHFREKYGLTVLAIWRQGQAYRSELGNMSLQFGDALLVYGDRGKIRLLALEPDFLVLSEETQEELLEHKAPVAATIVFGMLAAVVSGLMPIYIGALAAATLMVLTGCLTVQDAYRAIEWRVVVLIVGMLSLGVAMEESGAAQLIASTVLGSAAHMGTMAVVAALFLITAFAAQTMPTAAVAVLMSRIGLSTAAGLGLSPQAVMMVVALASSCAFMSPIGHPANLLVMGVGGYRFFDYTKVGVGLTLVILLVVMLVLPLIWPLTP